MADVGRSLWLDESDVPLNSRPALAGDTDVDVVIVGAGFTGLWTAYYLARLDPTLSILVLERDHVGFGASGRNGGWAVGELAAPFATYAARSGAQAALRQARAVFESVDEIGRVVQTEAISCGYHKGGTVRMARNRPQFERQADEISHHRSLGFTADEFRLMDKAETESMVGATRVLGGIYFGPTAAQDPARLVFGLADACERAGVTIVEGTAALEVQSRRVKTELGTVTAQVVVQATEGYTRDLAGQRRKLLPLYSRMVATAPLRTEILDEIGLAERPTFADDRHMVIYGQRTEDDRLAFGGRGVPYLFGSKIDPASEQGGPWHDLIADTLTDLFPVLADVEITHRWGGVMGVPRNWTPFVRFDRASGLGSAGGYVGEGVAPANLAGRTLADLITDTDSERVDLPWVGASSRRWEPEPLRWLAVRGSRWVMSRADGTEDRTGREAKLAVKLSHFIRGS